jgi:hypothetical protein
MWHERVEEDYEIGYWWEGQKERGHWKDQDVGR